MTTISISETDIKSERREFLKRLERAEPGNLRNLAMLGFLAHNGTRRQRRAAIRILLPMPNVRRWTMAKGIWCSGQERERHQSSYRFVPGIFKRLGIR